MNTGGSLRLQTVERVLRGVAVGDQVVHRVGVSNLVERRGAKLAVVGEQHDALGCPDYGPLDLGDLETPLAEHGAGYGVDTDKGNVDMQAFEEGLGGRAQQGEGPRADLATGNHDLYGVGGHREDGGEVDVVGDGGDLDGLLHEQLGRAQHGGGGIEEYALAGLQQGSLEPPDPHFFVGVVPPAGGEQSPEGRAAGGHP